MRQTEWPGIVHLRACPILPLTQAIDWPRLDGFRRCDAHESHAPSRRVSACPRRVAL